MSKGGPKQKQSERHRTPTCPKEDQNKSRERDTGHLHVQRRTKTKAGRETPDTYMSKGGPKQKQSERHRTPTCPKEDQNKSRVRDTGHLHVQRRTTTKAG
nr:hypothetical protein BgiMline_003915 [Biomphalaria glabrata]